MFVNSFLVQGFNPGYDTLSQEENAYYTIAGSMAILQVILDFLNLYFVRHLLFELMIIFLN